LFAGCFQFVFAAVEFVDKAFGALVAFEGCDIVADAGFVGVLAVGILFESTS
jgi:hypothetical protein